MILFERVKYYYNYHKLNKAFDFENDKLRRKLLLYRFRQLNDKGSTEDTEDIEEYLGEVPEGLLKGSSRVA
jgi:hypothetical protein